MTTQIIPKVCFGCLCFREKWGKCIIYYDVPKKYEDEEKCPHYTKGEHISYLKKRKL